MTIGMIMHKRKYRYFLRDLGVYIILVRLNSESYVSSYVKLPFSILFNFLGVIFWLGTRNDLLNPTSYISVRRREFLCSGDALWYWTVYFAPGYQIMWPAEVTSQMDGLQGHECVFRSNTARCQESKHCDKAPWFSWRHEIQFPTSKIVLPLNFEPSIKRDRMKPLVDFKEGLNCHRNIAFYQITLIYSMLLAGAVMVE